MKKITICGSMSFFPHMEKLQKALEEKGFIVFTPSPEGTGMDYAQLSTQEQVDMKKYFIDTHIAKIRESDAILLANYDKDEKKNYIGANTFLEMAFAYILEKKIFLLQDIPDQSNTVEIAGFHPIVLGGNLDLLAEYSV